MRVRNELVHPLVAPDHDDATRTSQPRRSWSLSKAELQMQLDPPAGRSRPRHGYHITAAHYIKQSGPMSGISLHLLISLQPDNSHHFLYQTFLRCRHRSSLVLRDGCRRDHAIFATHHT